MTAPTFVLVSSIYREIPLSRGFVARVSPEDYDLLAGMGKWCAKVKRSGVYAVRKHRFPEGWREVQMHRVVMGEPEGFVDHRNGDGLNNLRDNLRPATPVENMQNSRLSRRNKSGYKGVSFHRATQKWQAAIRVEGRNYGLGSSFPTPEAAALAYDKAARQHFGAFAALNFPEPGERTVLRAEE
jgi:hypothetical protein